MRALDIATDVRAALQELKATLRDIYGGQLRGVYLYGSHARGGSHEGSDVDVLIVLDGAVNPAREIDRISEKVTEISFRHDLLISTFPVPSDWFETRQSPFFVNIRREAVAV